MLLSCMMGNVVVVVLCHASNVSLLVPPAGTQWEVGCLPYSCYCIAVRVLFLENNLTVIFLSFLFFKVQFRIVSMDTNFIPVDRVVSFLSFFSLFKKYDL